MNIVLLDQVQMEFSNAHNLVLFSTIISSLKVEG